MRAHHRRANCVVIPRILFAFLKSVQSVFRFRDACESALRYCADLKLMPHWRWARRHLFLGQNRKQGDPGSSQHISVLFGVHNFYFLIGDKRNRLYFRHYLHIIWPPCGCEIYTMQSHVLFTLCVRGSTSLTKKYVCALEHRRLFIFGRHKILRRLLWL